MKRITLSILTGLACVAGGASPAWAIPAFARKYKTSCMTCHTAYPKLNNFGEAFRDNGYFWPGEDGEELARQEEPVALGQEAYKQVWPRAVWPGDVPAQIPLSLRAQFLYNARPSAPVSSTTSSTSTPASDRVAENDLAFPNNIWLLAGGTSGEDFSYFLHTHGFSEGESGLGIARAFVQWNDLGRELIGGDKLNLKLGLFEPAAVPSAFSSYANHGLSNFALNSYSFTTKRDWGGGHHGGALALGRNQRGGEVNGILFERLRYAAGLLNGNGTTVANAGERYDQNNEKDYYGRLEFKVGGLASSGVVPEETTGETTATWPETSIKLGLFGYRGDATSTDSDLASVDSSDVTDYRYGGGDVTLRFQKFELSAAAALARVDFHRLILRNDYRHNYSIQTVQLIYELFPWLYPYARYEFIDREGLEDMDRNILGVAATLRANIKLNVEGVADRDGDDTLLVGLDIVF